MCLRIAALLCVLGLSHSALAQDATPSADLAAQLSYLDEDAGLIVSLPLQQLQAAHALVTELLPKERQTINLAGLGASALLGFYPLAPKAWATSGFDTSAPILMQVAAAGPTSPFLRTRIILKVRNFERTKRAIERIHFRVKMRPGRPKQDMQRLFKGLRPSSTSKDLQASLVQLGVFLIARPLPLQGLLFAQHSENFIVIDLFDPADGTAPDVLRTLSRRPRALISSMPGAEALREDHIGIWLRTQAFGATLRRMARGDSKRMRSCKDVAGIGESAQIQAVGLSVSLGRKETQAKLQWHLRPGSTLATDLQPSNDAVLSGQNLLDGQVHLAQWDKLRDRNRPALLQNWDRLWAKTKTCAPLADVYLMSVAWPEVLGSFLSELSTLHPDAATLVETLGTISVQMGHQEDGSLTLLSEAWVRDPGAAIAKSWLRSLFGGEQMGDGRYQWGRGPMRPYAIEGMGGITIGSGFRPGSRRFALAPTSIRPTPVQSPVRAGNAAPLHASIATIQARPGEIASQIPTLPHQEIWKAWNTAAMHAFIETQKVSVTLVLQRAGDR